MSQATDVVEDIESVLAYMGNGPRAAGCQLLPPSSDQVSHIQGELSGRISARILPCRVCAAETSDEVSFASMTNPGFGLGPSILTGADQVRPPSVDRMQKLKSASVIGPR